MSIRGRSGQPKVLVFATRFNPLAARISIALACAGFHVAALAPPGHPVREVRKIRSHFAFRGGSWSRSIIRAIEQWSPDLLVCTDDPAVSELQNLYEQAASSGDKAGKRIADLIELSLGPPTSFPAMRNKSDFLALAEREGVRCPQTIVFPAGRAFEPAQANLNYPMVVKADHSDGGRCVRIVRERADLRAAVWELQTPCTWQARRFFGVMLGSESLGWLMLPLRRTISLQEHIVGRSANRAVVCWRGRVLAGISVEAVEVMHDCGPASVVRVIDHPEMTLACKRMVERLQLSGFVGFDFILDSANRAWLLELNPRVIQTCHFILADGTNFAASLYAQTKRLPAPPRCAPTHRDLVVLFPNEMLRSPSSEYLQSCQHDVPWDEPELVRCVLNRELRMNIRKRVRIFLERYFPSIVDALVRIGLVATRAGYSPSHFEDVPSTFVTPSREFAPNSDSHAGSL